MRGSVSCGGRTTPYDLTLKAGWNQVEETVTYTGGPRIVSVRSRGDRPATFYWAPDAAQSTEFQAVVLNSPLAVTRGEVNPLRVLMRLPEAGEQTVKVSLASGPVGLRLEQTEFTTRSNEMVSLGLHAGPELLGGVFHPVRLRFESGGSVHEVTVEVDVRTPIFFHQEFHTSSVTAGETVTRELSVSVSSRGNAPLPPTLNFEFGAVTGLQLSARPLSTDGGSPLSLSVTIAVAPDLPAGAYDVPVFVSYPGGRDALSSLRIVVERPTVELKVPESITAMEDESFKVGVEVRSVRGYSGPVTLELLNLPSDLSAETVTVNVPAGGVTLAEFSLRGRGQDFQFGRFEARVRARAGDQVLTAPFRLDTVPARTALPSLQPGFSSKAFFTVAAVGDTLWWLVPPKGVGALPGGVLMALQGGVERRAAELSLVLGHYASLLAAPDGTVWVLGLEGATRLRGTELTEFRFDTAFDDVYATDAQGRLWRVPARGERHSVARLREDGNWEELFTLSTLPSNQRSRAVLHSDPSGRWLLAQTSEQTLKIDTITGSSQELRFPSSPEHQNRRLAIGVQGQVWGTSSNPTTHESRLFELLPDGAVRPHSLPVTQGTVEHLAFDGADRLWMQGPGHHLRVLEGGVFRTLHFAYDYGVFPISAPEGGAWVVYWSDGSMYASRVR